MKSTIVAVVVCFVGLISLVYAQSKPAAQSAGRFVLAVSADCHTAWRIDTATGATGFCLVGIVKDPVREGRDPGCSPWMR
jgi:predicted branched-subunit amino acid permease